MTRTTTLNISPINIHQPRWVPSVDQVRAAFDPEDVDAAQITDIAAVSSGQVRVTLQRFDWPDTPSGIEARIEINQAANPVDDYIASGGDPEVLWRRPTELASAASVAAQRLQSLIDGGNWL